MRAVSGGCRHVGGGELNGMVRESFCFSVFICLRTEIPAVPTLWNFAHISYKITNVTNVRGEHEGKALCLCPPPWVWAGAE